MLLRHQDVFFACFVILTFLYLKDGWFFLFQDQPYLAFTGLLTSVPLILLAAWHVFPIASQAPQRD